MSGCSGRRESSTRPAYGTRLLVAMRSPPGSHGWMKQRFATHKMSTSYCAAAISVAVAALSQAGFVHRRVAGLDLFLDGPNAKARDAVHMVFASERVRPEHVIPAPDVEDAEVTATFRLLTLDALVGMKLTAFRDKDRVHVRDLIEVGLVDASWLARVAPPLKDRLQFLIDNPDG